jgi:hypothetical protein
MPSSSLWRVEGSCSTSFTSLAAGAYSAKLVAAPWRLGPSGEGEPGEGGGVDVSVWGCVTGDQMQVGEMENAHAGSSGEAKPMQQPMHLQQAPCDGLHAIVSAGVKSMPCNLTAVTLMSWAVMTWRCVLCSAAAGATLHRHVHCNTLLSLTLLDARVGGHRCCCCAPGHQLLPGGTVGGHLRCKACRGPPGWSERCCCCMAPRSLHSTSSVRLHCC